MAREVLAPIRSDRSDFPLAGVLILRGAEAAADAEVLHGLHEKRRAGDFCGFAADAGDDFVGAHSVALFKRLELREHAAGAGAATTADEGRGGFPRRILQNDVCKLLQFFRHVGEGSVLIALNRAVDAPGVLLRENPLGTL